MDIQTLTAEYDRYQQTPSLWEPANLLGRSQVLAFAAFVRQLARARRHQAEIIALHQQSADLGRRCARINQAIFAEMRAHIRRGAWRNERLRQELNRYTSYRPEQTGQPHLDYDGLDVLLRGVWETEPIPSEQQPRRAEMVHLESTPARVILELVDRVRFTPVDTFYDLGSGLGQVVCLVHLLTGVRGWGIEYEAAYCAYAQARAREWGLTEISFIQNDAQQTDLSAGTVFFLFTPFTGALLQTVLDRLAAVARDHPIRIGAYGACARIIARQPWLQPLDDHYDHEYKLALLQSR